MIRSTEEGTKDEAKFGVLEAGKYASLLNENPTIDNDFIPVTLTSKRIAASRAFFHASPKAFSITFILCSSIIFSDNPNCIWSTFAPAFSALSSRTEIAVILVAFIKMLLVISYFVLFYCLIEIIEETFCKPKVPVLLSF